MQIAGVTITKRMVVLIAGVLLLVASLATFTDVFQTRGGAKFDSASGRWIATDPDKQRLACYGRSNRNMQTKATGRGPGRNYYCWAFGSWQEASDFLLEQRVREFSWD